MDKQDARKLVDRYNNGIANGDEQLLLERWYLLEEEKQTLADDDTDLVVLKNEIWTGALKKAGIINRQRIQKRYLWPRIAAAASILVILSVGGYFLWHKQPSQQIALNNKNDIAPGGNKAILTLSNGKQINLNDAQNGIIANEAHESIKKAKDGTLSYDGLTAPADNQQVIYNTVTTPRGGQWPLILPDGTKVMLDAASSIRYPVSFNGNDRRVEITGQAYFEVAHNAKPFRVSVRGETIEDLGTHFNINAYEDEPDIKTTLLEGSVKVSKGNEKVILKPGQQSITQSTTNKIRVRDANTEEAIAWYKGLFQFDNANIQTVMRQLSKWYNIDVVYEGKIPAKVCNGKVYRNLNLSQVLEVLAYSKVHFRVEGRKMIVYP
jgi:transmembrane sensor